MKSQTHGSKSKSNDCVVAALFPDLKVCFGAIVWSRTSGPQNVWREARGPRGHMNRPLYAVESAALFADLAPLVIHSHFPAVGGDGGGRGNKTHDSTKRRVWFNVRSCMYLLQTESICVPVALIFMMQTPNCVSECEEGREDENSIKSLKLHLFIKIVRGGENQVRSNNSSVWSAYSNTLRSSATRRAFTLWFIYNLLCWKGRYFGLARFESQSFCAQTSSECENSPIVTNRSV